MTAKKTAALGNKGLTRRDLNRLLASAGLAMVAVPHISGPAVGTEMHNRAPGSPESPGRALGGGETMYFTWAGYDDPQFFSRYAEQHGSVPSFSLFGAEEEALQKVRAGFTPDVAHPCSYNTGLWRDAGVIQPIDTSRLSNWDNVFPQLKDLDTTQADGQQWFIPFDWGNSSILYRTDLVDIEEESWDLLWDERYSGRLSVLDILEDIVPIAAVRAGLDPFNLDDDGIAAVRAQLAEQRPLLRFYNSDMTTVEQALASGELVAAMTWNASYVGLRNQGLPVRFMNPKEGMLTWVCGMVMIKGAPNPDMAYDMIDAMLDPEAGQFLINNSGYGHSNKTSFDLVDEERLAELNLSRDPTDLLQAGIFLESLKNREKLIQMFEEVKAGF